jgi:hypothetical protein
MFILHKDFRQKTMGSFKAFLFFPFFFNLFFIFYLNRPLSIFFIPFAVARTSQKFFIPPISISLVANLCLYVSSYFGFRKLQKIKITEFITLQLKKCAQASKCSANRTAHMQKVETM